MAASAKLNIGLKNTKLSPPINGIQLGQLKLKKRKVEHIDHFPMQPTGISFPYRYESRDLGGCALTENNAIEYAVDDIPDSSCQYQ